MNHTHKEKPNSWMRWVMMLCCVLPFLIVILFSSGNETRGTVIGIGYGIMGVFIIIHFFMMIKKSRKDPAIEQNHKENDTHSHRGCCH